jgi:fructose-1,6-bisphosphatase/inositol monophosphatase family enzyme
VAAGQVDVVIDCNLQPYDYLPLVPVIEAAGGTICDWSGRTLGPGLRRLCSDRRDRAVEGRDARDIAAASREATDRTLVSALSKHSIFVAKALLLRSEMMLSHSR